MRSEKVRTGERQQPEDTLCENVGEGRNAGYSDTALLRLLGTPVVRTGEWSRSKAALARLGVGSIGEDILGLAIFMNQKNHFTSQYLQMPFF